MVVGAAEFSIVHAVPVAGVPLEFYSFPEDAPASARKFARSDLMLLYFTGLLGSYPFEKLAQVESTTTLGGMENSSAIFYAESIFKNGQAGESPVPHEVAHQWFGDSVTPADWDHLWLSEGFATYFNALFYEYLDGSGAMKRLMALGAEAVKKYHRERPGPVIDPSVKDISKKLNAFNYDKGAWVLHMLREILGDEVFFRGIRRYYNLYSGGTALTGDFQRVMESESRRSLQGFFTQWLYRPGWPDYRITWHWNEKTSQVELTVRQTQETGLFDMPLDFVFHCGDRAERQTFAVSMKNQTIVIPLSCRPTALDVDPDGKVLKDLSVSYR
jgi:aminopeptidase N